MKEQIEELEKEMTEINSQINALYGKLREKGKQLRQLEAVQSSGEFREFFESEVGKYIKVHYVVEDEYDDYEVDKYYVGLLGALTLSPTYSEDVKEALVAPIENCISIDARYDMIEKEGYFEITEEMFENSDEYSFDFITKEEANQFILDNTPQF